MIIGTSWNETRNATLHEVEDIKAGFRTLKAENPKLRELKNQNDYYHELEAKVSLLLIKWLNSLFWRMN